MNKMNTGSRAEPCNSSPSRRHDAEKPIKQLAVSPADGALMAGVGRTKLYEAISSGALRSFKLGRRRLIRVSDLDAWLDALADEQ